MKLNNALLINVLFFVEIQCQSPIRQVLVTCVVFRLLSNLFKSLSYSQKFSKYSQCII